MFLMSRHEVSGYDHTSAPLLPTTCPYNRAGWVDTPFSSTACIHLCTRCQEELLQAKERKRLGSSQTCVTGKIGHLAVTQLLHSALFGPLQPGPVLGPPILRGAAAHGHLKKWGEERHGAVSCRQTRKHSPTRRWPP